jgi:hypothetical protein
MQNRQRPVRGSSRVPVSWPMRYGNASFLAEGTVLDLTARGWRLAGTMPVVPGMRVTVQVSVPERATLLRVQRATVLWVKDHEFAIEAHGMDPTDQAWVTEFLQQKLGLQWMPRATHAEGSPPAVLPNTHCVQPAPRLPSLEDVFRRVIALQADSTDRLVGTRGNHDDSDSQDRKPDGLIDGVQEKMLGQAQRILRTMRAIHTVRARTGRDVNAEN